MRYKLKCTRLAAKIHVRFGQYWIARKVRDILMGKYCEEQEYWFWWHVDENVYGRRLEWEGD